VNRTKKLGRTDRPRSRHRRRAQLVIAAFAASTAVGSGSAQAYARTPEDGRRGGDSLSQALPARWAGLPPEFQPVTFSSVQDEAWLASLLPARLVQRFSVSDTPSAAQEPPARRVDIAAGPLGAAIEALERQTGVRVTVSNDSIRTLTTQGVSGVLTTEKALEQLLAGTGVGFRFTAPQTVALDVRVEAEAVEVTGRATAVSSPKYTEPLRDIPQTITVIPRTVIEAQGAATLRDVLRNVAGITFQAGEGGVPAGDQLTIRGFSARTDMFIDGVRDFGGYSRDAFNLEQVEVTKGPSSSTIGRGSTGGSINQVSKAPHLNASYDGSIGGGNAAYRRSTVDINQPLTALGDAGAAFRVNAMWTDSDVPGRDVVNNERWGIAPSFSIGLNKPTRLNVSYLHLAQDNVPEYGLPWVPVNTNPELQAYSNSTPPVDQSNFYGLRTRDYEDTDTDIATVNFEHDFNSTVSLRNLARYGQTKRDSVITAPRFASVNTSTVLNRQLQSRDMTDDIVANQTTVNARFGTGKIRHAVATGVEFSREGSENHARSGPAAPQADLFAPNPFEDYPGPITRTGAFTDSTATSAAAYAFDTIHVGDRWEFSGGVRWERFDVDFTSVAVSGIATDFSRTDDMTSWRAGAVYKPRPNGSVYVGYGTSFNPSAEGLSLSAATAALEPEKSQSVEVGTKWDVFGERLSLTGAIFRSEKTNARTPGVNPGDPPTVLAGEQRVNGVELGASGRITRQWMAFAAFAFMNSDIAASNTPDEIDNALALTPERTFNLWTTYDLPRNVSVGGGVQYMDSVFRNATNTAVVPSYWLINALASYEVNRHLTLRLNANNLANEEYVDRVGGGHYIPGPGRQVMITLGVNY